jgi:hypothetical protein
MADLYLRKVTHPQALDNYRVILKIDEIEFEIGSIGITNTLGASRAWTGGIDTMIPMRELESSGQGKDRKDCTKQFKVAWQRLCADPARLTEFLDVKRRARRGA